ncbi:Gmad2 immunoglobulin-like domain-containing protein [Nocardioides currus]|uniref:GerMN domain-containing protein n=1 Tax=Nocardioides currus TaxID=2133958 RepID=A0A2R7YVL7_9ACTN|nr:Gmad2 immunoglobulin-like domain-containing protein [Nocardioides currus]PUA80422.1 hypothetical protein C7S10_14975 [Nocardioides currus]
MTSPTRTSGRRLASALALGALALGATACSEEVPDRDQAPASSESKATDTTSESPSTEPSETPTDEGDTADDTVTVPVYFTGDTPQGPRLYREFRAVPSDNPLMEAAVLLTAGDTLDPDYRTEWPGAGFASIEVSDGLIVAELKDDGFTSRPDGMSKRDATLAVQQLVYTLQGVQQERVPVQVLLGGQPTSLFGLDTTEPFTAADALDVAALVNVTTPEQGSTVAGDTLEASGVASSFEANVPWEISIGDEVVLDGFATAEGWMDKLYPWETSIDVSSLEPGAYRFTARTDDPADGEGGGPTEDTKEFTLE